MAEDKQSTVIQHALVVGDDGSNEADHHNMVRMGKSQQLRVSLTLNLIWF